MSILPAYHISLTASQKRIIAEIAAIQSQIDWLMRLTVKRLLDVSTDTASAIMGSTATRTNSKIWLKIINEKHPSTEAKEWATYAIYNLENLTSVRNDYLHTLYGIHADYAALPNQIVFAVGDRRATHLHLRKQKALKISNQKVVDLARLGPIRDEAARLSCVFAHIDTLVTEKSVYSPWRHRLSKKRLVEFQAEQAQRATGRGAQRRSSK